MILRIQYDPLISSYILVSTTEYIVKLVSVKKI